MPVKISAQTSNQFYPNNRFKVTQGVNREFTKNALVTVAFSQRTLTVALAIILKWVLLNELQNSNNTFCFVL
jgi:hypothetical protein